MVDVKAGAETFELPSQSDLKALCLRPGRAVDLVLLTDLDHNHTDVRPSYLHEVMNQEGQERLVLGQTSPPLRPSLAGEYVEVTFLNRASPEQGGEWYRVGYQAEVLELRQGYRLSADLSESVVIVSSPERLHRKTLRLNYRLEPPAEYGLKLLLLPRRKEMSLIDLSLGGLRFAHSSVKTFQTRQKINLILSDEQDELILTSRVIRTGESLEGSRSAKVHTAVQFGNLEIEDQEILRRIFGDLSRHILGRRSGILDED